MKFSPPMMFQLPIQHKKSGKLKLNMLLNVIKYEILFNCASINVKMSNVKYYVKHLDKGLKLLNFKCHDTLVILIQVFQVWEKTTLHMFWDFKLTK